MKDKSMILSRIQCSADEKVLLSKIADKMQICETKCILTMTNFLSEHEIALAEGMLNAFSCHYYFFCGGTEHAERKRILFLPAYISPDDVTHKTAEISYLRILLSSFDRIAGLTHRDYLGALLGLGIKRETIGDISVNEGYADLILTAEMVPYISAQLFTVGKYKVHCLEIAQDEWTEIRQSFEEIHDTVASLRLDAILSGGFRTSRDTAADAIRTGKVMLNGLVVTKPDASVNDGDKISLRGGGKIKIVIPGGSSKKGRIRITLLKYQ